MSGVDTVPLAHPARSRASLLPILVAAAAGVAVLASALFLIQRQGGPNQLLVSQETLAAMKAELASSRATLEDLQVELQQARRDARASGRTVDRCRAALQSLARMWNRHTQELARAQAGNARALRKAHKRTESARRAAQRDIARCRA